MWGNKTVINWMTPFQCLLINPAQKPQGFLWWQQHTLLTYSRCDGDDQSSTINSVSKLHFIFYTQHFVIYDFFLMYNEMYSVHLSSFCTIM